MIKESQDKILPYVYKLTHKETNQFYIGYRSNNKVQSNLDLGFKYFSSSKRIKEMDFKNFSIEIIAEFFDSIEAYKFEQNLIKENFKDPLCLNQVYNIDNINHFGVKGKKHTEITKMKMSESNKGKNLGKRKFGESNGMYKRNHSEFTKQLISIKNSGKTKSKEFKDNLVKIKTGELNGMFGRKHTEESRSKMSSTRTGKRTKKSIYSIEEELKIFALFKSGKTRIEILHIFDKKSSYKTICQVVSRLTSKLLKLSSSDI